MARSRDEQTAISRSKAVVRSEVLEAGGGTTIRVAVRHTEKDHSLETPFHYGPAFSDQLADVIAHVRGGTPGDVDLVAEANRAADRAREEYPPDQGYEVWLEAIVPHETEERHVVRRLELEG